MSRPSSLQLIGVARLHCGDAVFELPDAMPGYLLAYLGACGEWVPREQLAALLWPDSEAADGLRKLRITLNRLRDRLRALGSAESLHADRRRIGWPQGSDLSNARAACAAGRWEPIESCVGQRFAPSLGFAGHPLLREWADGERRELLGLQRQAVLRLGEAGAPGLAAELAAAHLGVDRGDEDVQRLRLASLAALGRGDEAAEEFRRFDARQRAELGVGAGPALAAIGQGLAAGDADVAAAPRTRLVGRDDDLRRLLSSLHSRRLVTLVGLGGVGKSSLAQQLLRQGGFRAGLWLPVRADADVPSLAHEVLRQLGMPGTPVRDPVAAAGARLLAAGVHLLVLDDAGELRVDPAALWQLLDSWLASAPELRILATSRQPLHHAAELLVPMRSLATPGAVDAEPSLDAPAVQVLVARARQVLPGFKPQPHRQALCTIARRVGGLPLALRLVGSWLRWLSPQEALDTLELNLLSEPGEGSEVAAVLQQNWQRLDPPARRALAALSLLAAPGSLAWAQQASGATLPQLLQFMEQGLIERQAAADDVDAAGSGGALSLHPLVRSFAAQRLAAEPAAERAAREHHAHAVLARLRRWADWRRIDQRAALQDIGELLPDARVAWRWALAQAQSAFIAEAAPVLSNYHERLGRWDEGITLFESAQPVFDEEAPGERAALAAALRGRALLLYRAGRFDEAETCARRALAWARSLGHAAGIKANLNTLCLALWMLGRLDEGLACAGEARDLAAADGDQAGHAVFSANLALLHKKRGDWAQAEAAWRDALATHREVGNLASVCVTLNNLGNLLRLRGRAGEAVPLLEQALRLCDGHGFAASRPFALINLAQSHLALGGLATARALAEQALAEARGHGERMLESGAALVLADLALHAGDAPRAAAHLLSALRTSRAIGDVANLLEALAGYARWCQASGLAQDAAQAFATVRAHPQLHAELRDSLPTAASATTPAAVTPADTTVLIERACLALAAAA